MVVALANLLGVLLAQTDKAPKIPPPTREAALMALLAIVLLGMFLVVFILLGGHWVRRLGSHRRGPSVPPDLILQKEDREQTTPPPSLPADGPTGDTMMTDDTQS